MDRVVDLAERGVFPDAIVRLAIRALVRTRLREERAKDRRSVAGAEHDLVAALRKSPVALVPDLANRQHYEVPAAFFENVLGRRLKYSGSLFAPGVRDLDAAEEAMLALTAERACLDAGQEILDLGCGWGSLTLWMAERFPTSRITAVSNSASQRAFIEEKAKRAGIGNVRVLTADINDFEPDASFDRVVTVEMLEHVRNHELLFFRIASWLRPRGRLFVHVFAHRHHGYPFEDAGRGDWMARNFFTGGLMPSEALLLHFQRDLVLEERWRVSGLHYEKTANAWLARLDAHREAAKTALASVYGKKDAARWLGRWRLFFMACAEMFGFHAGDEWGIAHYRFVRR